MVVFHQGVHCVSNCMLCVCLNSPVLCFQLRILLYFASSYEFFNDLYHRFLLTPKIPMKCMCLQAMAIVYGRCHEEIGAFNDTRYIVGMLERVSANVFLLMALVVRLGFFSLFPLPPSDICDLQGLKIAMDITVLIL